jgi:hypothetical protein
LTAAGHPLDIDRNCAAIPAVFRLVEGGGTTQSCPNTQKEPKTQNTFHGVLRA